MAAEMPASISDLTAARQRQASIEDASLAADRRRRAAERALGQGPPRPAGGSRPGESRGGEQDMAVLYEARTSALASDVDEAGKRLVLFADRLELQVGDGQTQASIPVAEITEVGVHRRLSSATVRVSTTSGAGFELKGVKAAAASELRDRVAGLQLPVSDSSDSPTAEALRRLDELASMGLLSDKELAAKRAVLAKRPPGLRR